MTKGRRELGWAVWFVGLPGSGKSSIAHAVYEALREKGWRVCLLEMDDRRKAYFPQPTYDAQERERAYACFVEEAAALLSQGIGVLMDGTAYKREMRQKARAQLFPFAEIYIRCPLQVAMDREAKRPEKAVMTDLYRKAVTRRETGQTFEGLGEVIGVDVPFEEDPRAECILESAQLSVPEGREKVLAFLRTWLDEDEL